MSHFDETLRNGRTYTGFVGIGFVFLGCVGVWVLIDAFLLPGIIRTFNLSLASQFS